MAESDRSIDDIDQEITHRQDTLSSLPQSSSRRAPLFATLASTLFVRYTLSDDLRDLETSILQSTHAILLPFPLQRNIIPTFFFLTKALFHRALRSKLPGDVTCCLNYLYYTRNPSFERLGTTHNEVITLLVRTLTLRMELEPGNAMQCLEEMAVLCREQLASNQELHGAVEPFAEAVITRMFDPPSQQIVECLCEANARLPNSYIVSITLSKSFLLRFMITLSTEDYEGAMAPLDRIITSRSPAESPNKHLTEALAAAAQIARSFHGTPEFLEEAISRTRAHLISTSLEDPKHAEAMCNAEVIEASPLQSLQGLDNVLTGQL